MRRSAQSTHFKAFWVRPEQNKTLRGPISPVSSRLTIQTVVPKRLLKKAVDRNGLRRVIREAVRVQPKIVENMRAPDLQALRVTLVNSKGFDNEASRRALKSKWRGELDALFGHLISK